MYGKHAGRSHISVDWGWLQISLAVQVYSVVRWSCIHERTYKLLKRQLAMKNYVITIKKI